jgi:2-haloacid dehalogenase
MIRNILFDLDETLCDFGRGGNKTDTTTLEKLGLMDVVANLKKHYNLYIVSDGTCRGQMGELSEASLTPCFKRLFTSEEIGADKPSKKFFDDCFAQIPDLMRDETVIVGDSLKSDVQEGINAGVRSIWFDRKGTGLETVDDNVPDYRITNMRELPELLKVLSA